MLRGDRARRGEFLGLLPASTGSRSRRRPVESPKQRRPLRMEEQFDALLYLGPQSAITRSQTLCGDVLGRCYMEMRLGRMALLGLQAGVIAEAKLCRRGVSKEPLSHGHPNVVKRVWCGVGLKAEKSAQLNVAGASTLCVVGLSAVNYPTKWN